MKSSIEILSTENPGEKTRLTFLAEINWKNECLSLGRADNIPARPKRPIKPTLSSAKNMPRRRISKSPSGRTALLHAIAHIELNAIDLAWDLIARFSNPMLPKKFYSDWLEVAVDEARHFTLISERLSELNTAYGDFVAHDGLWEAAIATKDNLIGRLAIIPLVMEARGLDVTPDMISKLRAVNDYRSADILDIIYNDEIEHVKIGYSWFMFACASRGLEPKNTWQDCLKKFYRGNLKPPFNIKARNRADIPQSWYI